jgi:hypothetical protein
MTCGAENGMVRKRTTGNYPMTRSRKSRMNKKSRRRMNAKRVTGTGV